MNEPLWILGILFGFVILVQLLFYIHRSRQSLRSLQKEINASTQTMLDCSRKVEWLESRLEDLLDAAQLQSCDVSQEQQRLDKMIRTIKTEAMQNGYRLGLGELDQID
jgi:predicted Holliday junction resolvase-like endonuclease